MTIDAQRQQLMEEVLEYWYTVDFMNQGPLRTEQTRRDRETYSYVMNNPEKFSSLYRHAFLEDGQSILACIADLEKSIREKQEQKDQEAGKARSYSQVCHGKITIYVGSLNRAYLSSVLAGLLKCDPPLNPGADRIAIASFQLGDNGVYIKNSFSLSPLLWAVSRIQGKEAGMSMYDILDPEKYKEAQKSFSIDEKEPTESYEKIIRLTHEIVKETAIPIGADCEEAGLREDIHYGYTVYRTADEKVKRETEDYYGLSMSFYANDLAGFRGVLSSGKWYDNAMWRTLADYICAPYDMANGMERHHYDLGITALQDPQTREETKARLKDILSVDKSPWGKWPSRYQPFFMQQVAINLAVNQQDPFFAVNGPPGTGKTTLLREIIADSVVRKAMILSRFEKPDDLFLEEHFKPKLTDYRFYTFRNDIPDLRKYAIVVASSNNAAVENITMQLPLCDTVNKNLEGTGNPEIEEIRKLFDVHSAPIEQISRTNFDKKDWPKEPVDFPDIYFSFYAKDVIREDCWGLISVPMGKRGNVVRFHKKVLKQMEYDFYSKPGFWRNRLPRYLAARQEFIKQYKKVEAIRKDLEEQVRAAELRDETVSGQNQDRFVCLSSRLFDELVSDDPRIRGKAQMTEPNASPRYDRERENLFFYALKMTKEFVLSSERCKSNFSLLSQIWGTETKNNMFENVDEAEKELVYRKTMSSLIQTLQLFVPVISTTFASAGRFFKYVNKADALGTIVIDEAGQATLQMALRLLSRASRAIVVGDPNQIDPVVTDELAFLQSTLDEEIGKAYSDRTISVQKVADYLSEYGGMQSGIFGVNARKWVGVPLYVHNRCIEPMFSTSNRLSYGDAMLRITKNPDAGTRETFCYPVSQWINVSGSEEKDKNHFVRAQGERVLELLETAFARNAGKVDSEGKPTGPDLFIISPFHTAAEGMRQLLSTSLNGKYPVLAANRSLVEDWLMDDQNPHIGTVHTFQGREANEVILLLGCDESSVKSAKWVNRNIVNVAVSRAKYRLYAIGDVKVWIHCEPVMEMKFDLDSYAFDRLAAYAGAENTAADADDPDLPELPTSEMFDIADLSQDDQNEEYAINTDASVNNIRAYVPGFAEDFSAEQLQQFCLNSMDEFRSVFDGDVQNLLRMGMWNYLWLKPNADKLPDCYDASSVGICFCKAFELTLKRNFFRGLKILIPDAQVKGKPFSDVSTDNVTIGDYSTVISEKAGVLGGMMSKLGRKEYDAEWWNGILEKIRKCKDFRNICCHSGQIYTWDNLEKLLTLMFADSIVRKKGIFGKDRVIHGLMFETGFRDAINAAFGTDGENPVSAAVQLPEAQQLLDEQDQKYVKTYCRVTSRIRKCPADKAPLIQDVFDVRKKNGIPKRMNMQQCQKCGRRYINVAALSDTTHLEDYDLTAVDISQWK